MSKGFGRVERQVLDVLNAKPDGIRPCDIAGALFGRYRYTVSQFAAVRRALSSLRRKDMGFKVAIPYPNPEMFMDHMWTARDHALKRARAIAAMPDLGADRLYNDDVRAALVIVGVAADDPRFAAFDRRSAERAKSKPR